MADFYQSFLEPVLVRFEVLPADEAAQNPSVSGAQPTVRNRSPPGHRQLKEDLSKAIAELEKRFDTLRELPHAYDREMEKAMVTNRQMTQENSRRSGSSGLLPMPMRLYGKRRPESSK